MSSAAFVDDVAVFTLGIGVLIAAAMFVTLLGDDVSVVAVVAGDDGVLELVLEVVVLEDIVLHDVEDGSAQHDEDVSAPDFVEVDALVLFELDAFEEEDVVDDAVGVVVFAMFAVAFAMLETQAFINEFAKFHIGLLASHPVLESELPELLSLVSVEEVVVLLESHGDEFDDIIFIMLAILGMVAMLGIFDITEGFIFVNMLMVRSNMAMFCLPISSKVEPKGNMPPNVD